MRRHRLLNVSLGILLIVVLGGTYVVTRGGDSSSTSDVVTTTVARGTVRATVSASGTVEAPQDLGLNFTTAGTISSLDVKVGQKIHAGQIVGRVKDTSSQQSLEEALSNLSSAQASLAAAQQGQTTAEAKAAAAAVASSRAQVQSARSALSNDRAVSAANAAQYQQQIQAAQTTLDMANSRSASDQAQLAADQADAQQECSVDTTSAACQSATAAVSSDQSQVDQDLTTTSQDQISLDSAKVSQRVGLARDRQTIAQAVSQVRTAVKSLRSTIASNRVTAQANVDPSLVAQSRASVTSAQLKVDQAREALSGTVLRAPTAGTVISVSGVVGEVVAAGGNTVSTPQSSDSTTTSSATGVVVISDVKHLELHAYFSETDAAKLKVGQKATAALNAISDVTLRGTVVQIDATSTIVSNVVEYGVTIHLTRQPPGIKQGQTANVQVNTSVVHNALYVSSAAITSAGGQHTVSVLNDDGTQTTITVEVGLEGDQTTEITSGLSEGDRVVISSGTGTSSGFPTGGFPGGGFVGGGAGP
jgi:multidrug efflux pump subunit AcrA (membrane-fusion protein)